MQGDFKAQCLQTRALTTSSHIHLTRTASLIPLTLTVCPLKVEISLAPKTPLSDETYILSSGDLSRFGNSADFQREMSNVVRETYRVLKMGRRCTLGIGDNREHCFYVPVSFQMIRQYINEGFELEELVVKRQRYCAMFGLGTYLCVQFDFLCFTHEFIATLRKVPKEEHDTMILEPGTVGHCVKTMI